jgi:hypothetical protein
VLANAQVTLTDGFTGTVAFDVSLTDNVGTVASLTTFDIDVRDSQAPVIYNFGTSNENAVTLTVQEEATISAFEYFDLFDADDDSVRLELRYDFPLGFDFKSVTIAGDARIVSEFPVIIEGSVSDVVTTLRTLQLAPAVDRIGSAYFDVVVI